MSATLLHVLDQFTQCVGTYAFGISQDLTLLQECVCYLVDIPCKHHAILSDSCCKPFSFLLRYARHPLCNTFDDFVKLIQYCIQHIGNGSPFFASNRLSSDDIRLLNDFTLAETVNHDDDSASFSSRNMMLKQQEACTTYYHALFVVVDTYYSNADNTNRQKCQEMIEKTILPFYSNATKLLKQLSSQLTKQESNRIMFEFTSDLHVFCGIVKSFALTKREINPVKKEINKLLKLCEDSLKTIPNYLRSANQAQYNSNNIENKPYSVRDNTNNNNNDGDMEFTESILVESICKFVDVVLDVFGKSTQAILGGLLELVSNMLKSTKSVQTGALLKRMVTIFCTQEDLFAQFFDLVGTALVYFMKEAGDLRDFPKLLNEIFKCVGMFEIYIYVARPNCTVYKSQAFI